MSLETHLFNNKKWKWTVDGQRPMVTHTQTLSPPASTSTTAAAGVLPLEVVGRKEEVTNFGINLKLLPDHCH
jgi:hypothetical protein